MKQKRRINPENIPSMNGEELTEAAKASYYILQNGNHREYRTVKEMILKRAQEIGIAEKLQGTFAFQEKSANCVKFDAKPASDFTEEETTFVWYPYIPKGEYTVIMADGGTGKTTFCCGIAAAISNGQALPEIAKNEEPASGNVLMITGEDRGGMLRTQLEACGANLERVFILDCMDSYGLTFTDDGDDFRELLQRYEPQLVIIDPWHCFLGADIDINRVNAVRPVFQKVANIAKECDCGIILLSHVNKRSQSDNANNAATGSSDLINAARSAIKIIFSDEPGEENVRIAVHTKSNHAAPGQSIKFRITHQKGLVWDGFSDITKRTLEEAARRKMTPTEALQRRKNAAQINEALFDAILEKAVPGKHINISYDQMRDEYGQDIFETTQPKKELDYLSEKLRPDGIVITTGKTVRLAGKTKNGFDVYQNL